MMITSESILTSTYAKCFCKDKRHKGWAEEALIVFHVSLSLWVCVLPSSWWCGQWCPCVWWLCPGSDPQPWSPACRLSPESWRSPSALSLQPSSMPPRQTSGCPHREPSPLPLWCPRKGFQSRGRQWWPRRIGGPWGKRGSAAFPGSCWWGRSRCRCLYPGRRFHWHPGNSVKREAGLAINK